MNMIFISDDSDSYFFCAKEEFNTQSGQNITLNYNGVIDRNKPWFNPNTGLFVAPMNGKY